MLSSSLRTTRTKIFSLSLIRRSISSERSDTLSSYHNCIRLDGLPSSVYPDDVLRALQRAGVMHIDNVQIAYHRFIPNGKAFVELKSPDALPRSLRRLEGATLDGVSFSCQPCQAPESGKRHRGKKGRKEASLRGALEGDGPSGGINATGSDVVLWGVPVGVSSQQLGKYLVRNRLAKEALDGTADCEILKVEQPFSGFSAVAKFLLRFQSPSEAHSLIRRMHMTYFNPEFNGKAYVTRARIVI